MFDQCISKTQMTYLSIRIDENITLLVLKRPHLANL